MLIENFQIDAFRGLRGLTLSGLGRINLLMGPNNSGKSSVLEALALWADPTGVTEWHGVAQIRSAWPFSDRIVHPIAQKIEWLFPHPDRDTVDAIELKATGDMLRAVHCTHQVAFGQPDIAASQASGWEKESPAWVRSEQRGTLLAVSVDTGERRIKTELQFWHRGLVVPQQRVVPRVPHVIINAFSHRSAEVLEMQWSLAVKERFEEAVIALARKVDPGILGLQILNEGEEGARGLFVDHATRGFLPLDAFGDGARRAIHFALAIPAARGGLLLIDEIEIAIHTSVIGSVFDWLVDACVEHDVQLFATTHSLEAIDAMLGGAAGDRPEIIGWRLADGAVEKRLHGDLLRRLRFERGLEVRG